MPGANLSHLQFLNRLHSRAIEEFIKVAKDPSWENVAFAIEIRTIIVKCEEIIEEKSKYILDSITKPNTSNQTSKILKTFKEELEWFNKEIKTEIRKEGDFILEFLKEDPKNK